MRRALATAALITAAACGARTTLSDGAPATVGAGGATASSSSSSSATSSGSGGAVVSSCAALVPAGEPVTVPSPDGDRDAHDPWFADVPGLPLVVLTQRTALSPGPTDDTIAAVRVKPWGAWPPTFDAPGDLMGGVLGGAPFVAGVEPATATLSLFFVRQKMPAPGCEEAAVFAVDPLGLPSPASFLIPLPGNCQDTPLFVTTSADGRHLVATNHPIAAFFFRATLLSPSGATMDPQLPGCAATPIVADAIPDGAGFLVTNASGIPSGCKPGVPASVGRHILAADVQGGPMTKTAPVYDGADDIALVRLLPRPGGGAWLVWRESGASAEVQPPAMAAVFDMSTFEIGMQFAVTDAGVGNVAVGGFGDGLVSVFATGLADGGSRLTVRVFGAGQDMALAEGAITVSGWVDAGRMAVMGAPTGQSVLVAWTELGGESSARVVRVQRFDCGG